MKAWHNSKESYGLTSIFLHWSIALLIIVLAIMGLTMTNMADGDDKWFLYSLHKSLGLTVFGLIVLRIMWRLTQITPPLPSHSKPVDIIANHVVHFGLYALMLILPISGYLDSVAGGYKTQLFGLNMPLLVEKNQALADLATTIHISATYVLYVLFALHVAAALKHHFILHDHVMRRMLP